jgi:hypothetical protein
MHQQKLYSLVLGGLGLLGMILPWASIDNGFTSRSAGNGFAGWGLLALFGVVAIVISSLSGNKLQPYDQNMRNLAIGGFGGITLGAFISFMQTSGNGGAMGVKSGIGVWFCIIAGVLGLLWVTGVIKISSGTPPRQ